jgi:hypothetical protein
MDATGTLVEVLKGEGPRVLATLARTIGDLAVAEDALSDTCICGTPPGRTTCVGLAARARLLENFTPR